MKLNDFIKKHIKIDERNKSLTKLKNTCDSYYHIYTYLSKVLVAEYSLIFYILSSEENIFYSKVSDIMTPNKYNKFIKFLVREEMIQKDENNDLEFSYNKPNIYILTEKGKSFLKLKVVREFMEDTYK